MTVAMMDPLERLPPIREDLQLHPGPADAQGRTTWSLHDPVRNRFFRIGPMELALLRHWNQAAHIQELRERTRRLTGITMSLESVLALHQILTDYF